MYKLHALAPCAIDPVDPFANSLLTFNDDDERAVYASCQLIFIDTLSWSSK